MYLKHLTLTCFRNYARLEIALPARISVFQGGNAQGKTNLLEAIYYLATTKSPFTSSDKQLINWTAHSQVIPYAGLECVFNRAGQERTIQVTLVEEPLVAENTTVTRFRRQIRLDGVPRRAFDVVGILNVVLFLPEDISLVAGSPARRRRYLDITLCQMDRTYCRSLSRYNRVLRQRNALLRQICAGHAEATQLAYWDEQLSSLGAYVLLRRLWAIGELDQQAREVQMALTGGEEQLELVYHSSLAKRLPSRTLGMPTEEEIETASIHDTGQRSDLAISFLSALRAARREEIARAATVLGPHRDDFRFLINGHDATIFGSRGQQRTAVLALKLAEVKVLHQQTGEKPILLLDDVMSELDQSRGHFLLQRLPQAQQAFITTTNSECFSQAFLDSAVLWRIYGGSILRQS